MQFKVVIPDQCVAGQTIRIHISDGTEANVKIPNGLCSGDSFIFELPTNQMQNPRALILQQQQQESSTTTTRRQAATTTTTTGYNNNNNNNAVAVPHAISEIETGYTSNDDDNDNNNNNNNNNTNNLITTTASIVDGDSDQKQQHQLPHQNRRTALFLEREVIDCQDFFLALSVGLLVGSAIVIGFLMGILHVTADIYASHPIEKPKSSSSSSSSSSRRNINVAAGAAAASTVPVSSPIVDNNAKNHNNDPFPIAEANMADNTKDDGSSVDGIQMINEALDLLSQ